MRFEGRLLREGRWWLAEVPMLQALTQGRTRKEALEMIADWLETCSTARTSLPPVTRATRAALAISRLPEAMRLR
jgi:predicted RNase H-like HicB family nuclease